MPVTRSEGKGRKPLTEPTPSSSEGTMKTSATGTSTETSTALTATGTTTTETTQQTATTTSVMTAPSAELSTVTAATSAALPSATPSAAPTLPDVAKSKLTIKKPSAKGGKPAAVTEAFQDVEMTTVKNMKKGIVGLPEPCRSQNLRPSSKGGVGGSTNSKMKAYRIAKAKEELMRLKVELAAAQLAALEIEDTEDEEDDDVSDFSGTEINRKVDNWLENQLPRPVLAIANEPYRPTEEPVIVNTEQQNSARELIEIHHQESPRLQQSLAGAKSDFSELAAAITHAVKAAQRPKFTELPLFSGSHQEWLPFRAAYFETENMFTAVENTNRLRRNLKGRAKEAVEGLLITSAHPTEIMKTLESRFGRPEAIAMMEMETIRGLPRLTESPRDICIFATKVSNIVATLKTLQCMNYMYNPEVSKTVVDKLTPTLRYRYYDYATTQPKEDPDLLKIEKFLKREAELCGPYALPEQVTPHTQTATQKPQKVHNVTEKTYTPKCPVCDESGHTSTECEQFKHRNENQRWDIAKSKHLCFRCLRYRNKTHSCRAKSCGINDCKYFHHKMLHYTKKTDKAEAKADKEAKQVTEIINSTWTVKKQQSYLKIIPIQVKGPRATVSTFALLDDGSTVTLVDKSIVERIGATGPIDPLKIESINDMKTSESASRRVNLKLKGLNDLEEEVQARTVKNLQVSSQRVSRDLIEGCKHLSDIRQYLTYDEVKPQVLIGQDNWHLLLTSEVRRGDKDQLVASLTPLGWVLHGTQTRTLGRKIDFVTHVTEEKVDDLENFVKQHFEMDALCINPKKPKTDPEERALCIQKKIDRDSKMKQTYTEQMDVTKSVREAHTKASFELKQGKLNSPSLLEALGENEQTEDFWPTEKPTTQEPSGEEKVHHVRDKNRPKLAEALPEVTRFSNWDRLRYTTARVLQFVQLCKPDKQSVHYKRTKKNAEIDPSWRKNSKPAAKQQVTVKKATALKDKKLLPVSAENLVLAEELLMRSSQEDSFGEEIADLKNKKPINRESRLRQLSVEYVNEAIRLRSRIQAAQDVTEDFKSPMILDGDHHIVRLWIQAVHRRLHHAGVEATINECRQQYWVLRVRPITRTILRRCLFCRMKMQAPPQPRTGDLPACRLAHHKRPFTFTGVDYFGPLSVTVGRTRQKRYVAIFTCLTTRAIHLEIAGSLSSDSAVMALRRMIARRGCPTQIWSDNGTNLKAADKELRQAIDEATAEEAAKRTISWRYIPPGAPFMGGVWERMVRSVKNALTATLHERHPTEEVLSTLLAEAEYTVNSRPLTHVSVSAEDPEALTPNHFLLGGTGRVPQPGTFNEQDTVSRSSWRSAQQLADIFWSRWVKEYLPELQYRREPHGRGLPVQVDDLVQIVDPNLPRNVWIRGRVIATYPGPDNIVRTVDVRTKGGVLRRPVKKLVVLPLSTDVPAPGDDATRLHGGSNVRDRIV